MLEMNKVMIIGNLTRDPEVLTVGSGASIAKLGLAVNRRYKTKDGQQKDEAAFVDVTAWNHTAKFAGNYLKKGGRIYVEGRLNFETWEDKNGGGKRSKLSVTADRLEFADSKPKGDQQGQQAAPATNAPIPTPQPAQTVTQEDLPF